MNGVEGIVLRTVDYGENNLIVTALTPSAGKIAMMARGAKKPASPLRACTTPLTKAHFQTFGGKMPSLIQGSVIQSYRTIKTDLSSMSYAAYSVELLDRILPERESAAGAYGLLSYVLNWMDEGGDPEIAVRLLEARILDYSGVMPDWTRCALCSKTLDDSPFFSFALGGPLHQECGYRDPMALVTKPTLFKLVYTFQKIPLDRLGAISLSAEAKKQMNSIFRYLLEEYAGITLRSRRFLESLELD